MTLRHKEDARAILTTKSNSNRPADNKDLWPRLKTKFQAILALPGHLILFPQLPSPISIPIHGNHSQPVVIFTAHPEISGTRISSILFCRTTPPFCGPLPHTFQLTISGSKNTVLTGLQSENLAQLKRGGSKTIVGFKLHENLILY